MLPDKLSFVDIETTGTSLEHDRIIEIGILRIENNRLVKKYDRLINPQTHVSPFITSMTGIAMEELEKAPIFYQLKDEISDILKDSIFVAHNVRFDYGFLVSEFRRHHVPFSSKHFCTVKLFRLLYPNLPSYNLDSLINFFGFACKKRHRAYDDAKVLVDFYRILQKKFTLDELAKPIQTALKRPSVPIGIPIETLDNLPESPGVYIFYGDTGVPLYVGKSVNIRDRVFSHFAADHRSSFEMKICQQVKQIETIQTAGELGAFFTESQLIKKLQPIYNKQLRLKQELVIAKRDSTIDGFNTISIERRAKLDVSEIGEVLIVAKSEKQAKDNLSTLAKDFELCLKLLGLEKTEGACFSYHLGRCRGACLGLETTASYNSRVSLAFAKNKLKDWPFKTAIIIKEKGQNDKWQAFVVDKWRIVKAATWDENGAYNVEDHAYEFDYDNYKILNRYLSNPKNLKNISTTATISAFNQRL